MHVCNCWFCNYVIVLHFCFVVLKAKIIVALPFYFPFLESKTSKCRSNLPRGLSRGSAAARLLGLWV